MNTETAAVRTGLLSLLTGLMFSVGPVTVDLSLPAMPAIQHDIGAGGLRVELTLTLLFLGLTLSQLVFGAIADRYGRRAPLLAGLVVYSIASLGAAFAPNIYIFAAARLLQAFGFGVAVVLIRSAVVDVCDERRTARVFSVAVTMVSLASVVSPTIGGQLLDHFGWRAIFLTMAIVGGLTLVAIMLSLPETFPRERRSSFGLSHAFGTYGSLLRDRRFLVFATICAAAAAYQLTYNTGAPSVLIEHHGVTPRVTGLLFSLIALSTACASQANAFLLKWYSPERITNRAVLVSVAASVAILICVFTDAGGVPALVAGLFALISTLGFIMGNTLAGAISSSSGHAGAASALVGVMQFLFGTLGSASVGLFPDASGRVMGIVLMALSLLSLLMVLRAPRAVEPAARAA